MAKEEIYVKNKESVLVSKGNYFLYEVSVFCHYKKYFSLINTELYSSNYEIPNFISHFFITKQAEIVCTLFSAPLPWLLSNDYIKYIKPIKVPKSKLIKTTKNGKSKTTIGKSRSWTAPC